LTIIRSTFSPAFVCSFDVPREEPDVLAILIVGCALLGLAVGSFLNVVIYRVPRQESIVSPRSRCPTCSRPIREYDNIPVISWLILRGHCRNCGAAISPRYLVVEVLGAVLFGGLAARMGFVWELPAYLVFLSSLLALSCIDLELLVLPKRVIYPALILVTTLLAVASAATHDWDRLLIGGVCATAWFAVFFVMNFTSPRILGFGDVRLAPLLGVALGWIGWRYVVLGFFAGNLIGAIIGLSLIAAQRMKREQPVPYGVFLSAGAALAVFAGPEILSHFQNLR
jgi:leader peptidase (prepilin peptidase) / N-methyltransferase